VRINDNTVGFDVYFVPSAQEQENYNMGSGDFQYYDGCSGKNYASYSGTCHDVTKNSGLLIAVPDELNVPLTKFDVWLYEKSG